MRIKFNRNSLNFDFSNNAFFFFFEFSDALNTYEDTCFSDEEEVILTEIV